MPPLSFHLRCWRHLGDPPTAKKLKLCKLEILLGYQFYDHAARAITLYKHTNKLIHHCYKCYLRFFSLVPTPLCALPHLPHWVDTDLNGKVKSFTCAETKWRRTRKEKIGSQVTCDLPASAAKAGGICRQSELGLPWNNISAFNWATDVLNVGAQSKVRPCSQRTVLT